MIMRTKMTAWVLRSVMAFFVLGVMVPLAGGATKGSALSTGVVTATSKAAITINNQQYALDPKVKIEDDEGREIDLNVMAKGDRIKFSLNKKKVDHLILILPK